MTNVSHIKYEPITKINEFKKQKIRIVLLDDLFIPSCGVALKNNFYNLFETSALLDITEKVLRIKIDEGVIPSVTRHYETRVRRIVIYNLLYAQDYKVKIVTVK